MRSIRALLSGFPGTTAITPSLFFLELVSSSRRRPGLALLFIGTVAEEAVLAQDRADLLGKVDGLREGGGNEGKSDEGANHGTEYVCEGSGFLSDAGIVHAVERGQGRVKRSRIRQEGR
jgi:hypothetical protein